ncbi:hypothetical protein LY78DRAFT_366276 [Colletotrichum sublineola]|nr:hypothetical protein LY78DRAFT_366276 [Colletotrichum sublineola]
MGTSLTAPSLRHLSFEFYQSLFSGLTVTKHVSSHGRLGGSYGIADDHVHYLETNAEGEIDRTMSGQLHSVFSLQMAFSLFSLDPCLTGKNRRLRGGKKGRQTALAEKAGIAHYILPVTSPCFGQAVRPVLCFRWFLQERSNDWSQGSRWHQHRLVSRSAYRVIWSFDATDKHLESRSIYLLYGQV